MRYILKVAMRKAKSLYPRTVRQIIQRIDPVEREFHRVWPLIDSVEGFLVSPAQERWLFRTAKSLPDGAIIVEIGSFKGRSTCSLAYGCRGTRKHVFAIDTFEGNATDFKPGEILYGGQRFDEQFFNHFSHNIEVHGLSAYVTQIRGWSSEVAKTWDKPIHLLFIDGSHEYEDVLADFENFFPHVVPGGIVAFHDVHTRPNGPVGWPGVLKVWQDTASLCLSETGSCSTIAFGKKKRSDSL